MNFFEQEMRLMLEDNNLLTDMKFTGKMMIGKLDNDKVLKAEIVTTGHADHYTAIKASVINKNNGIVDTNIFKFSDIIGLYNRGNGYEKIDPYIWDIDSDPRWHTPISKQQKAEIGNTVLEYGQMFQDQQYALGMQFK